MDKPNDPSKWSGNKFHIPFQVVASGLCIWWFMHLPAPNKAVLAIGVVAVLMTITEMKAHQKAVWIVIILFLAFLENRAINKDRADQIAAQQESISNMTGGNSFPVFLPRLTSNALEGNVRVEGQYPMHELNIQIMDHTEIRTHWTEDPSRYVTTFSFPLILPNVAQALTPIPFSGQGEKHIYEVHFYAWNGSWYEDIFYRKDQHGEWRWAYQVFSDQQGKQAAKLVFHDYDPLFPSLPDGKPDLRP